MTDYDEDEFPEGRGLALVPVFSGDQFKKHVAYPVIIEAWHKRLDGSRRRKYQAQFNEKERATIARYQTKFYRWHLVTGTPKRVMMKLETLQLLQRAVAFFAEI